MSSGSRFGSPMARSVAPSRRPPAGRRGSDARVRRRPAASRRRSTSRLREGENRPWIPSWRMSSSSCWWTCRPMPTSRSSPARDQGRPRLSSVWVARAHADATDNSIYHAGRARPPPRSRRALGHAPRRRRGRGRAHRAVRLAAGGWTMRASRRIWGTEPGRRRPRTATAGAARTPRRPPRARSRPRHDTIARPVGHDRARVLPSTHAARRWIHDAAARALHAAEDEPGRPFPVRPRQRPVAPHARHDRRGEAAVWEPAAVAARVDLHGSGPRNTRAEHPVASRRGTREIRRRADVRREFSRIHGSIGR